MFSIAVKRLFSQPYSLIRKGDDFPCSIFHYLLYCLVHAGTFLINKLSPTIPVSRFTRAFPDRSHFTAIVCLASKAQPSYPPPPQIGNTAKTA